MANAVPSSLALSVINTSDPINSAPHRNNYAAIQAAVNGLEACLSGGTVGQVLEAVDGSDVQWGIPSGARIASTTRTSAQSGSGTTFGTGTDVFASALTFTADGTSSYVVRFSAAQWSSPGTGDQKALYLNLDAGTQSGLIAAANTPTGGYAQKCNGEGVLVTPSAGSHTVNVRLVSSAGSLITIQGGSGGSSYTPMLLTVEKL